MGEDKSNEEMGSPSISYWWRENWWIQCSGSICFGKPNLSIQMKTFVVLATSFHTHNRSPPGPMFLFVYCNVWRCLLCCKVGVTRGSDYLFTAYSRLQKTKLTKPLCCTNLLHNGWHWVFQTTPNCLSPDGPNNSSHTLRLTRPPAPSGVRPTKEGQLAHVKSVCRRISLEL